MKEILYLALALQTMITRGDKEFVCLVTITIDFIVVATADDAIIVWLCPFELAAKTTDLSLAEPWNTVTATTTTTNSWKARCQHSFGLQIMEEEKMEME